MIRELRRFYRRSRRQDLAFGVPMDPIHIDIARSITVYSRPVYITQFCEEKKTSCWLAPLYRRRASLAKGAQKEAVHDVHVRTMHVVAYYILKTSFSIRQQEDAATSSQRNEIKTVDS